jgi:hypothetical protein
MAGIRATQTGGMIVNAGGASSLTDSSSIATGSPVEFAVVGRTPTSYRWSYTTPANSKSSLNVVTGVTLTPAAGAAPIAHLLDIPGTYVISCVDDTGLTYTLTLNVQAGQATVYPGPMAPFYGPPGSVETPLVGQVLYCNSLSGGQLTVKDVSGNSTPFGSTFVTLTATTFPASAISPTIYQAQATASSPTGAPFAIYGQNAYGVGNNSTGDLTIGAGVPHGSGTAGHIKLESGGVTQLDIGPSGMAAAASVSATSFVASSPRCVTQTINTVTSTALDAAAQVVFAINTTYDLTITLPNPTVNSGRMVSFFIAGSPATHLVYISRYGTEKIDGAASDRAITSAATRGFLLSCDGTDWFTFAGPVAS